MGLLEILLGITPNIRGQFGEYLTEYALTNSNLTGNFVVLKNLYIPKNGRTTEVDLVLLHEKGLFVFESKNYSGWIFGDKDSINWTQSLRNGRKYQFYNPVLQNKSHISAIARQLNMPEAAFISFIVFSDRCLLMKVPDNTPNMVITQRYNMLRYIQAFLQTHPVIYSLNQLKDMEERLKVFTNKSYEEKKEHINNIKTKCPVCNGNLVQRNGKYGLFYGCSNYPNCRYTRKI